MQSCLHCGSLSARGDLFIPPTPVPTLIGTNASPSPSEESAIRGWLLNTIDSWIFCQLGAEIDRVEVILDGLRRKRQVLRDTRKQHTIILSAVRRLPVELLSEIFIFSLPNDWKDEIHDFRRAVMLPASVCRYWRNVALSTPRLWNSISFWLGDETVQAAQAKVDLARLWIARSGGLLLSIHMRAWRDDDPNHPAPSGSHPVINVIAEYAQRWEYASFYITYSMLIQIRSARNCLPHLHTLRIGHFRGWNPIHPSAADRPFRDRPSADQSHDGPHETAQLHCTLDSADYNPYVNGLHP